MNNWIVGLTGTENDNVIYNVSYLNTSFRTKKTKESKFRVFI